MGIIYGENHQLIIDVPDPLIDIKLRISIPLLMKLELKSSKMLLYFWEILLCRATNNVTVITTKNKKNLHPITRKPIMNNNSY